MVISLLFSFAMAAPGNPPLKLSQKDAAVMALQNSLKAQEVTEKYSQKLSDAVLARQNFEWKLTLQSGYQTDRTQTLTQSGEYTYRKYLTTVDVVKQLTSGTTLTLDLARTSQKADISSVNSTSTTPNQLTNDSASLSIEQNIWGNAFGRGDRALLAKADLNQKADLLLRADELQNLVLSALRLYWNTYVAQENLKESLAARDRYEKLVATVRKKAGNSYAAPGEYSQIQAEYESRVQAVKQASVDYVSTMDQLLTFLQIKDVKEIEFTNPKELPPLPATLAADAESTRIIRSQKFKVDALEQEVRGLKSKSSPTFSLVGTMASSGLDTTGEGSYNDLSSGNHSKYYGGVKFYYQFGESYQSEQIKQKQAELSLEQTKLNRMRQEKADELRLSEQKTQATRQIAESYQRQFEFREKATRELTKSYGQGRTDISILIDNINKLLNSEVQLVRSFGDYSIALNEWAAARDKLIPDNEGTLP